jgi:hypothetical protein
MAGSATGRRYSVIEILHYEDEFSWRFECARIPLLSGGGRTFEESREAAEHAVRQYLTKRDRRAVTLAEAAAEIRHACLREEGVAEEGVAAHIRDEVAGLRSQS